MSVQTSRRSNRIVGVAIALLSIAAVADETEPANIADAVASGDASVMLRPRYEFVDQESFGDNANAGTVLMRLNYDTSAYRGFSGFLEFDYVAELLKDYNSGAGTSGDDRDRYPVVADPGGPDLNQLYLQYAAGEDLQVRAGRQRIILNDQRFVGGVGWRQNEQTYDSLSFKYDGLSKTSIFYNYVTNVARIFGTTVPAGSHKQDTHLLNSKVQIKDDTVVYAYAYLIDNDDAPAFSTNTFGVRAEGDVDIGKTTVSVLGEYSRQSDATNNPASFDTNYYRLQGIWKQGAWFAGAGYEVLGSDNGQGFRTPLATLHAFNGWADQFLATPAAGLEDLYVRAGTKALGWSFEGRYHDFGAETSSENYGREVDMQASKPLGDRYDLLLKAAFFDSRNAAFVDVTKFWLMVTARF